MAASPTEKSFDGSTLGSREDTSRKQSEDLELGQAQNKQGTVSCCFIYLVSVLTNNLDRKVRGWRRLFAREAGAVESDLTKPITRKGRSRPFKATSVSFTDMQRYCCSRRLPTRISAFGGVLVQRSELHAVSRFRGITFASTVGATMRHRDARARAQHA